MPQQRIITLGESAALPLSEEVLSALGLNVGDSVEISLLGRQLLVQPAAKANRGARLDAIMDDVFERRREAYEQLAEGP